MVHKDTITMVHGSLLGPLPFSCLAAAAGRSLSVSEFPEAAGGVSCRRMAAISDACLKAALTAFLLGQSHYILPSPGERSVILHAHISRQLTVYIYSWFSAYIGFVFDHDLQ
jgi:hypothetical protein